MASIKPLYYWVFLIMIKKLLVFWPSNLVTNSIRFILISNYIAKI